MWLASLRSSACALVLWHAGAMVAPAGLNDDLEQLVDLDRQVAEDDEFDLLDSWAFDIDVGSIWNVGDNTPLDYQIIPAILSLRTPSHWVWDLANGGNVAVRSRVNVLMEAIVEGPENHYFGMSASPSIEYWFPSKRTYLHFAIGGGAGYIDSQGVDGGQGQDFTWNWFMHGGVRHFVTERVAVSLGVYFQHNSNRGATDPNPGIDAVGPLVGLSWHF